MVSGVGRGMGVLDGVVIIEGDGIVLGVNLEHPIVTNGSLCCLLVRQRRAFPKLLWEGLVYHTTLYGSAVFAVVLCLSVSLSVGHKSGVLLKRLNVG